MFHSHPTPDTLSTLQYQTARSEVHCAVNSISHASSHCAACAGEVLVQSSVCDSPHVTCVSMRSELSTVSTASRRRKMFICTASTCRAQRAGERRRSGNHQTQLVALATRGPGWPKACPTGWRAEGGRQGIASRGQLRPRLYATRLPNARGQGSGREAGPPRGIDSNPRSQSKTSPT